MKPLTLILIAFVVLFLWLVVYSKSENYKFLGGMYNLKQGGAIAELNEECLQLQDGQQCQMMDGTPGNCVTSGHCVPNMLVDLNIYDQDVKLPYCTKPVFWQGCDRFAQCQSLKTENGFTASQLKDVADECRSWFSPLGGNTNNGKGKGEGEPQTKKEKIDEIIKEICKLENQLKSKYGNANRNEALKDPLMVKIIADAVKLKSLGVKVPVCK